MYNEIVDIECYRTIDYQSSTQPSYTKPKYIKSGRKGVKG